MFNVIFVSLRKKLSKEGRDEESPRDVLYLQDLLNLNIVDIFLHLELL